MNMINLSLFLDIIRQINGGNIISNIPDVKSRISLPGDNVTLYCQPLPKGMKYFFFANLGDTQNIEESISQIETITIYKRNEWSNGNPPHPSDSYIIYIWQIPEFTEEISKQIIRLEENEFTYKKYVFYYTAHEYEAFSNWLTKTCHDQPVRNIIQMIKPELIETDAMQFLLRLIIKVPCLSISFQTNELPDFDQLVAQYILRIQNKEERNNAKEFNKFFQQCLSSNLSPEEIAEKIVNCFEG